ncbi:MAG: DUF11 domain-containing protein [Planctomycetota bacterium]|jgi:uncharacterized repeat protein (TIGR01451 family)
MIICLAAVRASAFASLSDVTIIKGADVSSVAPGDVFTYNLRIANEHWDRIVYPATDVFIRDLLPDELIFNSWYASPNSPGDASPSDTPISGLTYIGSGVWAKDRLTSYEMFWLYINVQVDPGYGGYEIINTARISTEDPEWDYSNNESTHVLSVIPAPGALVLGIIGVAVVGRLRRIIFVSRT